MSTVVEFRVPPDAFLLPEATAIEPDAEFELARTVADPDELSPFLWGSSDDPDEVFGSVGSDPTVRDATLLLESETELLLRVEWADGGGLLDHLAEVESASVEQARYRDGVWRLRVLFPDRTHASEVLDYCDRQGMRIDVGRVYGVDELDYGRFDLSAAQYEAVQTAVDLGYYDIPRAVTTEELAAELGISQQALSERLRRAHSNLAENVARTERRTAGDAV